jgi:molybdenum cofactor guanylyltransferase
MMESRVAAVVLAGGLARRMGGGDKALRLLHGQTLLDHVLARLRPQVDRVALSANGDPARFAQWGLPVLADPPESRQAGPLAGILAGLEWSARLDPPAALLLSAPSDTPWLPTDLLARLLAARSPQARIVCASSGGRQHPVVALWPVALRADLAAALGDGVRGVARFAQLHGAVAVEFPVGTRDPYMNINDAAALAAAEAAINES